MTTPNPGRLEIFVNIVMGSLLSGFFKEYVNRIDLQGNARVLELGPCAGNSTRHLARRLQKGGGCLTAIDILPGWIEVTRKRLAGFSNVELIAGDITHLNLPAGCFDAVFINFVVHDILPDERAAVMQAALATLVPGGKLFIREPLRFISEAELRRLVDTNGMIEVSAKSSEIKTQGTVFEGVYRKTIPSR